MKLYATIKNERGGKKSTGDDTRILIELTYKNKIIGEVGLYRIFEGKEDLGYRVVWKDETGGMGKVIREEEGKKQNDKLPNQCEDCKKAGWIACCNLSENWHK